MKLNDHEKFNFICLSSTTWARVIWAIVYFGKVTTCAKTHLGNVGWGNGGLGKKGFG